MKERISENRTGRELLDLAGIRPQAEGYREQVTGDSREGKSKSNGNGKSKILSREFTRNNANQGTRGDRLQVTAEKARATAKATATAKAKS